MKPGLKKLSQEQFDEAVQEMMDGLGLEVSERERERNMKRRRERDARGRQTSVWYEPLCGVGCLVNKYSLPFLGKPAPTSLLCAWPGGRSHRKRRGGVRNSGVHARRDYKSCRRCRSPGKVSVRVHRKEGSDT